MHRTLWYPMAALAAVFFTPPPAIARVYVPAVREMTERRTMTSKTWALADGTFRSEIHTAPINYRSSDGKWNAISTSFSQSAPLGCATNTENVIQTCVYAKANEGVRVSVGDIEVTFRPIGCSNNTAAVNSNLATIENVWPETRLVYEVLPGRIKETAILNNLSAPTAFSWLVQMNGTVPVLEQNNAVSLIGKSGDLLLSIAPPWMIDANGNRSNKVQVLLERIGEDWVYIVTPDPVWLRHARYPVSIDPTVSYAVNWSAVVVSSSPNVGYPDGIWCDLWAGVRSPIGGNDERYRTVVNFADPYSPSSPGPVPLDADVLSAEMVLVGDGGLYSGTHPLAVYPVESDLTPTSSSTPTWNQVDAAWLAAKASGLDSLGSPPITLAETNMDVVSFDVTGAVANWVTDRMVPLTFLLRDPADELSTTPSGFIYAFCGPNTDPTLFIEYNSSGWYTFQGNMRHTGRANYPVRSGFTAAWPSPATLTPVPPTTYAPEIAPGLLAVPGSGDYPIVYAVVSDGYATYSAVHRIVDNGDSVSPSISASYTLLGKASGTPLLFDGRLFVTTTIPGWDIALLYILDPTTLLPASTGGNPNPVEFDGTTYSSPVPNPAIAHSILLTVNIANSQSSNGSGYDPCLACRSTLTGLAVQSWNGGAATILMADDIDGTPPAPHVHGMPTLYCAPSIANGTATVVANPAWINTVSLTTGLTSDDSPEMVNLYDDGNGSPVSWFAGKRFFGMTRDLTDLEEEEPSGLAWLQGQYADLAEFDDDPSAWTTPAIRSERIEYQNLDLNTAAVIFADDSGALRALGTDFDVLHFDIPTLWSVSTSNWGTGQDRLLRASPLVAGSPGGDTSVFIAGDNAQLEMHDAVDGGLIGSAFAVNSKVRSSMAAHKGPDGNLRLYVLTLAGGLYCFH